MRGQHGSVTPLVAVLAVLLLVAGGAVALVVSYAGAQHRARGVADVAAVAGAAAYAGGRPCEVAGRVARENGAEVLACRAVGDLAEHVVSVEVGVAVEAPLPRLPRRVSARAHAGRLA